MCTMKEDRLEVEGDEIRLCYVISTDQFFYTHFLERACAARDMGFDVYVICKVSKYKLEIESKDINVIPLEWSRRSLSPVSLIISILRLRKILRCTNPQIVHLAAWKPILSGLAATVGTSSAVICAFVGGGYLYTGPTWITFFLRIQLFFALRYLMKSQSTHAVFENTFDQRLFSEQLLIPPARSHIIRGSGVPKKYTNLPKRVASDVPTVTLASRLVKDKGILEFCEASRILKHRGVRAKFLIAGGEDTQSRMHLSKKDLKRLEDECGVAFVGYREDMDKIYEVTDIFCLPSYREGLSRALLEAMSYGISCVTTDVPGCRDLVIDGITGIIVKPKKPTQLADAIEILIRNPALRKKYGERAKNFFEKNFESQIIVRETVDLYNSLATEKKTITSCLQNDPSHGVE